MLFRSGDDIPRPASGTDLLRAFPAEDQNRPTETCQIHQTKDVHKTKPVAIAPSHGTRGKGGTSFLNRGMRYPSKGGNTTLSVTGLWPRSQRTYHLLDRLSDQYYTRNWIGGREEMVRAAYAPARFPGRCSRRPEPAKLRPANLRWMPTLRTSWPPSRSRTPTSRERERCEWRIGSRSEERRVGKECVP